MSVITDICVVDKKNHPRLFKALEMVSHDMGAQAGHANYGVPLDYESSLRDINTALCLLSDEEFESFCIGEEDEMLVIKEKSQWLEMAHRLLNELYD
jgi:hypothetical protein